MRVIAFTSFQGGFIHNTQPFIDCVVYIRIVFQKIPPGEFLDFVFGKYFLRNSFEKSKTFLRKYVWRSEEVVTNLYAEIDKCVKKADKATELTPLTDDSKWVTMKSIKGRASVVDDDGKLFTKLRVSKYSCGNFYIPNSLEVGSYNTGNLFSIEDSENDIVSLSVGSSSTSYVNVKFIHNGVEYTHSASFSGNYSMNAIYGNQMISKWPWVVASISNTSYSGHPKTVVAVNVSAKTHKTILSGILGELVFAVHKNRSKFYILESNHNNSTDLKIYTVTRDGMVGSMKMVKLSNVYFYLNSVNKGFPTITNSESGIIIICATNNYAYHRYYINLDSGAYSSIDADVAYVWGGSGLFLYGWNNSMMYRYAGGPTVVSKAIPSITGTGLAKMSFSNGNVIQSSSNAWANTTIKIFNIEELFQNPSNVESINVSKSALTTDGELDLPVCMLNDQIYCLKNREFIPFERTSNSDINRMFLYKDNINIPASMRKLPIESEKRPYPIVAYN